MIKSLTNNTEIITLLNRLGYGVSYSTLSEMRTENAYRIADEQANADVILPETLEQVVFSIYVADNIDRNKETLTGIIMFYRFCMLLKLSLSFKDF